MRSLSPPTLSLLKQLGTPIETTLFHALCQRIADREEPAALSSLLPYLLDERAERAHAAREAAQRLLDHTRLEELGWIEQELRWRSRKGLYYFDASSLSGRWSNLLAATLLRASSEPGFFALLAVASFHDNGFVRETAVQLLDGCANGCELPYLLLRTNDWVPVVQRAAHAAVRRRVLPAYAEPFLRNIALCDRLGTQRRNDLRSLHDDVWALLRSPAARSARQAAFTSTERRVRRAAFLLSTESDDDLRSVILSALRSDDLWIRIWGVRTGRNRLYGAALRETLGQARGDRSIPVRREALLGFVSDHPELLASLLDPSPSLREMVRYYLRKSANLQFADVYHARIQAETTGAPGPGDSVRLAIAIAGLGETGTRADADSLTRFVCDTRSRVRQASLGAIGRLDPEVHFHTLTAALGDSSPRVVKVALQAMGSRRTLAQREILNAYETQQNPLCRRHLVRTFGLLSRWTSIVGLLRACEDQDGAVAELAVRQVPKWCAAANYPRPTSAECSAVLRLLASSSLPTLRRSRVHDILKEWDR